MTSANAAMFLLDGDNAPLATIACCDAAGFANLASDSPLGPFDRDYFDPHQYGHTGEWGTMVGVCHGWTFPTREGPSCL